MESDEGDVVSLLYPNNLNNWEFGKKTPENFYPEKATLAERQGASDDNNFGVKPTSSKIDSSSCFGINNKLLEWNQNGWIPGPTENDLQFLKRVESLQARSEHPSAPLGVLVPLSHWEEANLKTKALFDFILKGVNAFYSNERLPFWEGAALWLSEEIPVIQLRSGFAKGIFAKTYGRSEVLSHEAVHGARMAFNEPRFEEILAYATSENVIRRWIGPFFRYPWESYLFIGFFSLSLMLQMLSLWFPLSNFFRSFFYIPWILIPIGFTRLCFSKYLFWKCKRQLEKLIKNRASVLAVMIRLTDNEIALFNKLSPEEIAAYAKIQESLRWRLLKRAYFFL